MAALLSSVALFAYTEPASAQEIMLTGPLAGAPAVRKLRLYREGRFELAFAPSFTLLSQYERTIFLGGRINYNLTDWLAIGLYGAGAPSFLKISTSLTNEVQKVNKRRRAAEEASIDSGYGRTTEGRLTGINLGPDFEKQVGSMNWMLAPQVTAVPFRGKLALFQSIYLDTDLYGFAGAAFVNVSERKSCDADCTLQLEGDPDSLRESRMAIAPTFGAGLSFYINKWSAVGFEWRAFPFSWNTAGFDTRGAGPNKDFPDGKISDADREFQFNQVLTVSYNVYLPFQHRFSE